MNLALNSLKDSYLTTYCSELFHLIPFIPLNYIPLPGKLNCYFLYSVAICSKTCNNTL